MPVHIHTATLDAAVITGGMVMISAALRALFSWRKFRRRDAAGCRNSAASQAKISGDLALLEVPFLIFVFSFVFFFLVI